MFSRICSFILYRWNTVIYIFTTTRCAVYGQIYGARKINGTHNANFGSSAVPERIHLHRLQVHGPYPLRFRVMCRSRGRDPFKRMSHRIVLDGTSSVKLVRICNVHSSALNPFQGFYYLWCSVSSSNTYIERISFYLFISG